MKKYPKANRPFLDYLKPLSQSESWCPFFHILWDFIHLQIKLIFMWTVVHQVLFWQRGLTQLRNGLLTWEQTTKSTRVWGYHVRTGPGPLYVNWIFRGAGVAQWWEHLPPTNVSRVRFPDPASYVGWVCCWFSSLLREVYPQVLRFSPLLKNQHFQIPILAWKVSLISAKVLEDMTLK